MAEEQNDEDERSEEETIGKAIKEARAAFEKSIEKEGLDPAYWSLDLIVSCMDSEFANILRQIKDMDYSGKPFPKENKA